MTNLMTRDEFQKQVHDFAGTQEEAVALAEKFDGQIENDRPLPVSMGKHWTVIAQSTWKDWWAMIGSLHYVTLDENQRAFLLSEIADRLNEGFG